MERNILLLLCLIAFGLMLFGCTSQPQQTDGRLKVVASFYPLYDFASNVGGNRVEVSTMIPTGVDVHEFDPSPSDIKAVADADVFIYNGAGLEPWVPNLLSGVNSRKLIAVDASSGIQLLNSQDPGVSGSDPHIWLDPVLAKKQVANIRDAFIQKDPAGRDYYTSNAAAYMAKLDNLDAELRAEFPTCEKKDILITHATLAYFCKEYGCRQIPIEGVSEQGEPSAGEIVRIIQQAKADNVTVVFFESLINPQSAQVIAQEINGTIATFNSLHGLTPAQQQAGENYLSLMQANVEAIKKALVCN
ncbi:MAG: metal ABC transporter substrate-binding protein [Candidatus ainarchaeum sp.]|nr:metal ABC transporter substrate-binding protein [Candidatus ainarchaeum sp.]